MTPLRIAVIGAGSFGRNHARVLSHMDGVTLAAVVDTDPAKAQALAAEFHTRPAQILGEILPAIDAAVVATPTVTHEAVARQLLASNIDVLIEKPIADSSVAGDRLATLARDRGRILQVGHLERFNPAVIALEQALTVPLFFEVHRLSVFTPRSLDIDVVLDLMIHDLDIILNCTRDLPTEIRAAGISVLSPKVDIANVRLSFASGCIANLTASRVSTEKVRKLRLFQPGEYISLDYQRQDAVRLAIRKNEPNPPHCGHFVSQNPKNPTKDITLVDEPAVLSAAKTQGDPRQFVLQNSQIAYDALPVTAGEPLALELAAFVGSVRDRTPPRVDGFQGANALRLAEAILVKIKEHGDLVSETVRRYSPSGR